MRAANPTKARSKGSKGSSDNLDRMGNGGKPVVSRKDLYRSILTVMRLYTGVRVPARDSSRRKLSTE